MGVAGSATPIPLLVLGFGASWEVGRMTGTLALAAGRLELESIVRAPLVVIADPVVADSGPPATVDELGGGGAVLLERPAGTILAFANPSPDSGLFIWVARDLLAVVADPDRDTPLAPAGELTVCSGRLVVGAPEVVAAWGADVDTGDSSPVRARMHRGRQRVGLVVVAECGFGIGTVATGAGAAVLTFPAAINQALRLDVVPGAKGGEDLCAADPGLVLGVG